MRPTTGARVKPTEDMINEAVSAIHAEGDFALGLSRPGSQHYSVAKDALEAGLADYELGFELDAAEREVMQRWAATGEAKLEDYQHLAKALDRAQRTLVRLELPPAEPQPDAPTDIAKLPDWWDERRRKQHKPDRSRCAAELRIALATLKPASPTPGEYSDRQVERALRAFLERDEPDWVGTAAMRAALAAAGVPPEGSALEWQAECTKALLEAQKRYVEHITALEQTNSGLSKRIAELEALVRALEDKAASAPVQGAAESDMRAAFAEDALVRARDALVFCKSYVTSVDIIVDRALATLQPAASVPVLGAAEVTAEELTAINSACHKDEYKDDVGMPRTRKVVERIIAARAGQPTEGRVLVEPLTDEQREALDVCEQHYLDNEDAAMVQAIRGVLYKFPAPTPAAKDESIEDVLAEMKCGATSASDGLRWADRIEAALRAKEASRG